MSNGPLKIIRVVFCWPELPGYMVPCWDKLASDRGFQVHVICGAPGSFARDNGYRPPGTHRFALHALDASDLENADLVANLVATLCPDVIYLPGWQVPSFTRLPFDDRVSSAQFILGFDTIRRDTWRQGLARFKLGRYLERMNRVMVPGERGWEFARNVLKVSQAKIRRGLYSFDFAAFQPAQEARRRHASWPQKFLFVGRYVPAKGIDVLLEAYREYRSSADRPWPISFCGTGELGRLLQDVEGVHDLGFVQPSDLPAVMADHGAFVMPSRHEPWGVAIGEAAAAGLPLICSEACGALAEFVRPYFNGLTVEPDDAGALARALFWIHQQAKALPEFGRRSQHLAEAFSAEMWATRWQEMLTELAEQRFRNAAGCGQLT